MITEFIESREISQGTTRLIHIDMDRFMWRHMLVDFEMKSAQCANVELHECEVTSRMLGRWKMEWKRMDIFGRFYHVPSAHHIGYYLICSTSTYI